MLIRPSCRLGSPLSSVKTQISCTPRCALSQRRHQTTYPKPITTGLTAWRNQPCLDYTPRDTTPAHWRFASSSATSSDASTASHLPQTTTLTWNDYLALRKTRRRYNLVASIFTSLGTTSVGITVLSQQNFDQLGGLFGLDPFIVLGLATAGSGAVGWLLGPFVGNAVFGMVHRGVRGQIAEKEKDFYRKIKRYRVDPSSQSFSNPVPDYYGEKIGSVSEFRNWMKDQRAYNKKRQSFL